MSAEIPISSLRSNRRLLIVLLAVAVGMFGFGYALVPVYNMFCKLTGLNGKTGRISENAAVLAQVDRGRSVTVEFVTTLNASLPWDFYGKVRKMQVHPGEINQTSFYARNNADHTIVGQAIPSVSPGLAAQYFNKTECFCFTQQTLKAGEARDMRVRFVVDARLPRNIDTITLSYTFFDTDRPGNPARHAALEDRVPAGAASRPARVN
jgi:cytochrome c oxidase assembly protein subunit 11